MKGCNHCGYNQHSAALDFDHIDKSTKLFNISNYRNINKCRLKEELSKVQVLCANCHRIKTYETADNISGRSYGECH